MKTANGTIGMLGRICLVLVVVLALGSSAGMLSGAEAAAEDEVTAAATATEPAEGEGTEAAGDPPPEANVEEPVEEPANPPAEPTDEAPVVAPPEEANAATETQVALTPTEVVGDEAPVVVSGAPEGTEAAATPNQPPEGTETTVTATAGAMEASPSPEGDLPSEQSEVEATGTATEEPAVTVEATPEGAASEAIEGEAANPAASPTATLLVDAPVEGAGPGGGQVIEQTLFDHIIVEDITPVTVQLLGEVSLDGETIEATPGPGETMEAFAARIGAASCVQYRIGVVVSSVLDDTTFSEEETFEVTVSDDAIVIGDVADFPDIIVTQGTVTGTTTITTVETRHFTETTTETVHVSCYGGESTETGGQIIENLVLVTLVDEVITPMTEVEYVVNLDGEAIATTPALGESMTAFAARIGAGSCAMSAVQGPVESTLDDTQFTTEVTLEFAQSSDAIILGDLADWPNIVVAQGALVVSTIETTTETRFITEVTPETRYVSCVADTSRGRIVENYVIDHEVLEDVSEETVQDWGAVLLNGQLLDAKPGAGESLEAFAARIGADTCSSAVVDSTTEPLLLDTIFTLETWMTFDLSPDAVLIGDLADWPNIFITEGILIVTTHDRLFETRVIVETTTDTYDVTCMGGSTPPPDPKPKPDPDPVPKPKPAPKPVMDEPERLAAPMPMVPIAVPAAVVAQLPVTGAGPVTGRQTGMDPWVPLGAAVLLMGWGMLLRRERPVH